MSTLAAGTWGMPGWAFAAFYPVLVVVVLLVVVTMRNRGGQEIWADDPPLTPVEIAYVRDGRRLAVATALGALRAGGAVDDHARPVGTSATTDLVERAVLQALEHAGRGRSTRRVDTLLNDLRVRAALDAVHAGLEARGLVRSRAETTRALTWSLLAWATVGLGLARMAAGSQQGRPIGFIAFETMVAFLIALGLSLPMTFSPVRPVAHLLEDIEHRHRHLDPALRPSWATYGAAGAGMSVALFGTGALVLGAPAFAHTVAAKVTGGGDGGSGSAGDGGGGGCGGGGCGG